MEDEPLGVQQVVKDVALVKFDGSALVAGQRRQHPLAIGLGADQHEFALSRPAAQLFEQMPQRRTVMPDRIGIKFLNQCREVGIGYESSPRVAKLAEFDKHLFR